MRRLFAAAALLLLPTLASAQLDLLVGKRVRAKLAGPDGPWVHGFVMETNADSLTVQLADARTIVRLSTADVTVERADGHDNRRGFWRGALIGGFATIALMASTPEFQGEGLETMLYLVFPPLGAALGAGVGVAMAPERWTPVSSGTLDCGGWRALDGSARTVPIVTRGPRNRKRGAAIGALVLGGLGLVGGLTDPQLPQGEVPGIVVGNALVGALAGSLLGPREKVVTPASCP